MSCVFENIRTYETWNDLFYSPLGEQFCDVAISRVLTLLGPEPGGLVLDAGCGVGVHSIRAARAGFRVHAIDISHTAIREAASRAHQAHLDELITFEQADLTNLDIADESYSHIISWGVIIHIPDVGCAIDSLARILRPGGRLALYFNQRNALEFRAERIARRLLRRPLEDFSVQQMGNGYWYRGHGDKIWIWHLDVDAVSRHLQSRGLRLCHRSAGCFSELHVRTSGAARRLTERLNLIWLQRGLPASLAVGNLLVFEKPGP